MAAIGFPQVDDPSSNSAAFSARDGIGASRSGPQALQAIVSQGTTDEIVVKVQLVPRFLVLLARGLGIPDQSWQWHPPVLNEQAWGGLGYRICKSIFPHEEQDREDSI